MILCLTFYTAIMVNNVTTGWTKNIIFYHPTFSFWCNIRLKGGIFVNFMEGLLSQVPFNVALKNKTSEDVSLLVIDSIVDGNENFGEIIL